MKKNLLLVLSLFAVGSLQSLNAQVVINEFSASNLNSFVDDYGGHEDWIELYNTGGSAVDLGGYYLSDNSDSLSKYEIPAGTMISAGGFKLFYADGRGTALHTSFKINQTKNTLETIVFSDPSEVVLDSVEVKPAQLAHSRGRVDDGAAEWGIYTDPTPGITNNTETVYTNYADRPDMDMDAGFYTGSVTVAIVNNAPNSTVRYTINGNKPTAASTEYTVPLTITETTIVKAYAIPTDPNELPSFEEFDTFFIDEVHTLPVMSVSGTSLTTLANGNQNLVPEGSAELFDKLGVRVARGYGEFNSHGQDSWVNDQRSIDLVCRDEMGISGLMREKIFRYSERDKFQRLILRAGGDDNYPDGSDTPGGGANLRDAYLHNLCHIGGMNFDQRLSEKCIMYMNGQYWGVYDLREKPDDHDYTDYYYGQGKYDIDYIQTWGDTWAQYGDDSILEEWDEFYQWIMANDMNDPAAFNQVLAQLDVTSLIDYVMANSFTVCSDWLNWNTGWWRGNNPNGTHQKWGYLLWDNDATWGYYINYTGIESTEADAPACQVDSLWAGGGWGGDPDLNGHLEILTHLRENPIIDQYYISRYIDLRNTVFSCENLLSYLDTVEGYIYPEMQRHIDRWGGTWDEWQGNVQELRDFITERCTLIGSTLNDCYDLTGPYDVTFAASPNDAGDIKVNSNTYTELPFTGEYFGGIDILVTQIPDPDYAFNNWSVGGGATIVDNLADSTSVQITEGSTVTANYILVSVNEIAGGSGGLSAAPSLFDQSTQINYTLAQAGETTLRLYSLQGKLVADLVNKANHAKGSYALELNLGSSGLAGGVYLLQLVSGGTAETIRISYAPR